MIRAIQRLFIYLQPLWTGSDGKISLKSSAAICLLIDFVSNLRYAIRKWNDGRSLEGLSLVLGIEAGLVISLLGLTAWSNMTAHRIDSVALNPAPAPVTVTHAENVVGSTKAETVNAAKVDTVNTQNTNIERVAD